MTSSRNSNANMSEGGKSQSPSLPNIPMQSPVGSDTSIKSHDSGISLPSITHTSTRTSHPQAKVRVKLQDPLIEKHKCIVCFDVLRNPVKITDCGHVCCLTCFASLLGKVPECPIDQTHLDKKKVTHDDVTRREIDILPIYCSNDTIGCKWRGTYSQLVAHLQECGCVTIRCPNKGCPERMERRFIEAHSNDECPKLIVACQHCEHKVRREDERTHERGCPQKPVTCPNICDKPDMPAEQLTSHLADECPKETLSCPFSEAGCEFRDVRDVIRAHVTEKSDAHLTMVVDKLVSYQSSLLVQSDVIEDQMTRFKDVETSVYALEKLHGAQLLWKIDNYADRLDLAKNGKSTTIFSPPFLSNKHGYNMTMSANLNGGGKARGKFLSVYVCLLPGEYDALLAWPFSHRVTFTLVTAGRNNVTSGRNNVTSHRNNVTSSLKPSPCKENAAFLWRPGNKRNPSFGVENFVKLSTVADYVLDDCLYLSIKVDLTGMLVL